MAAASATNANVSNNQTVTEPNKQTNQPTNHPTNAPSQPTNEPMLNAQSYPLRRDPKASS